MTHAICIFCFSEKFGAFTACPACKNRPESVAQYAASFLFSDNLYERSTLQRVEEFMEKRVHFWRATGRVDDDFYLLMKICFRYVLKNYKKIDLTFFQRTAKQGLFRREVDLHIIGNDGYQHRLGKSDRKLSSNDLDIFLIENYQNGERRLIETDFPTWVLFRDRMKLVEKQPAKYLYPNNVGNSMYFYFIEQLLILEEMKQPNRVENLEKFDAQEAFKLYSQLESGLKQLEHALHRVWEKFRFEKGEMDKSLKESKDNGTFILNHPTEQFLKPLFEIITSSHDFLCQGDYRRSRSELYKATLLEVDSFYEYAEITILLYDEAISSGAREEAYNILLIGLWKMLSLYKLFNKSLEEQEFYEIFCEWRYKEAQGVQV